MPVLPLVASITVWPGLSLPVRSASSITPSASRSLTEPNGLKASILTKSCTSGGASLPIRTTGVLPTVSRMFANLRPMVFLRGDRLRKADGAAGRGGEPDRQYFPVFWRIVPAFHRRRVGKFEDDDPFRLRSAFD